jgi:hemin uptake protein HemP
MTAQTSEARKRFPEIPMAEPVTPHASRQPAPQPPRVTSRELLGGRPELIIVHDGREYRLRITQNGKLILTA